MPTHIYTSASLTPITPLTHIVCHVYLFALQLKRVKLCMCCRSTTSHQNFDLHLQQADARLRTYRDLRAFDRDNFVQAYTRKDIKVRGRYPCGRRPGPEKDDQ